MGGQIIVALIATAVFSLATCNPVPLQARARSNVPQGPISATDLKNLPPEVKAILIRQLEDEMVRAAKTGAAAEAVRLEQELENEILGAAVTKLIAHRGDRAAQEQDMKELRELVQRDKRQVEALSGALSNSGSSSSASADGDEDTDDNGGGSNILSLASSLLGPLSSSSSGGGGDGDNSGGGSNVLSLVGSLLGSSSGSSSGGGDSEDGGGGSNILSLVTSILGSSSGSSSGSGGDDSGDGGGSNILGLVSGILGSSSSSGSDSNGGGGASVGTSRDPLQGGTYDDLIGKGPFSNMSNFLSRLLMFKFSIFKSLFSLVTNLLTSSSAPST